MTEQCPHGMPVRRTAWWREEVSCNDCYTEEWVNVKKPTVVGLIILLALIWVPLCLLLAGVFW